MFLLFVCVTRNTGDVSTLYVSSFTPLFADPVFNSLLMTKDFLFIITFPTNMDLHKQLQCFVDQTDRLHNTYQDT